MLTSQSHTVGFFFLYILPRLIIKSAALRVGQEDRDLGVQSRLEPWSPIKRLAVCGQSGSGLSLPTSQSSSHTYSHEFVMIIRVALARLNTTAQRLSLNNP